MKIHIGGYKTYNNVFIIVSLYLYLTYIMLPAVPANLPTLIRYVLLLTAVMTFYAGTILINRKEIPRVMLLTCTVVLFSILVYFGKWEGTGFFSYMINAFLFWMPLIMASAIQNLNISWKRKIWKYYIVLVSITTLTTIIGNKTNAIASRVMASGTEGTNGADTMQFSKMNIGGYGFIYSLVVLLPFLFYKLKEKKGKIFYITLVVITTYVVFYTQYTMAVIAVVLIFTAIFILTEKKKYFRIISVTGITLLVVLMKEWILKVLYIVEDAFYRKSFYFLADRLAMILELIVENSLQGDVLKRSNLYLMSWNAFTEHPFIGNLIASNTLGGHSEILDILGATGLLGMLIFVCIILKHTRIICKTRGKEIYRYSWLSFCSFLFIASVNTVLTSPQIAVSLFIVPLLLEEA